MVWRREAFWRFFSDINGLQHIEQQRPTLFCMFQSRPLPIYTFQRLAYARVYETYINNIRDELCRNKRFLCKQC